MGAMYAKDFISNLHDKRYGDTKHSWNAGGLRHVIKVLQGRKVAIELDNMTGHVQVGVKLVDVRDRFSGGEGIAVEDEHGITVFGARKVGVIVPLEEGFGSSKFDAIDSERRELSIARELFRAEVGKQPAGRWEQTSGMYHVAASYRPDSFTAGEYQYRKYTLGQIQQASLCDSCLLERETQQHEHHCPEFTRWLEARRENAATPPA